MPITRIKPQGIEPQVTYLSTPTWASGVNAYDFRSGPIFFHTTVPTASWTANFTNVPTTYPTNQTTYPIYNGFIVEVKIMATLSTSQFYPNGIQIDGVNITPYSLASTTATISKLNIWTIWLVRVSNAWSRAILKSAESY